MAAGSSPSGEGIGAAAFGSATGGAGGAFGSSGGTGGAGGCCCSDNILVIVALTISFNRNFALSFFLELCIIVVNSCL